MSYKQKQVLNNVKISTWDIIKKSSGGHHDITNISGLSFLPGPYKTNGALFKKIWLDMGKAMQDKHLKEKS